MKKKISTIIIVSLFVFTILVGYISFENENTAVAAWQPEIEISTDIGTERQEHPSVAVSNGKVHAVWEDEGDGDCDIYYRRFDGVWEPEQEISTDAGMETQVYPSIAVDGDVVHVVWADEGDGDFDIYYRRFDGISWQPEQEISTDIGTENQTRPAIAAQGGKIYAVWEDDGDGDSDLFYSYFDGVSWQPEQEISTDAGTEDQTYPEIAVDNGRVHVVWNNYQPGDIDIYYRYFDGTSWQPQLELSTDVFTESQTTPSIAVNDSKVHVVWQDREDGDLDIYYRHFDGTSWQPEMEISTDIGTERQYGSSIAVIGNVVHVTWTDRGDGDQDTYYRYFDGASWQPEMELSTDIGTESQYWSEIAVDWGDVHVVWVDWEDGDSDIYYRNYLPPPPKPDLHIKSSDITFTPPSPVMNGTTVQIGATVRNIGDENTSNVLVRFHDGFPTPFNQIGEEVIPFMTPFGGIGYIQINWVAAPVGIHDIYVVVDPEDTITERLETNNMANRSIEVSLPDYTLWNPPLAQQKVSVGDSVLISSQVKNVGKINATAQTTIAFYNQSDSPFKTYTVPPLSASKVSKEYNATWTAPTTPGIYYVVIEADYGDLIIELNETNNTYVIEFNVTKKPLPDYILWNTKPLPPQQKVSIGSSVLISSQVKNVGDGNATVESTIAFYNQSAPSPFKMHTVPSLNASEVSIEYNATWIAPTIAGIYYVVIEADYYNDTGELDENNNTCVFELNVTDKPITAIDVGTPHYGTSPIYINCSTPFAFSVVDFSGTGYNTFYCVDDPPWNLYTGPFTVTGEGAHTIYFNSTDNLGGAEDTKELEIIVDCSPPDTTLNIGDPKYGSSPTYINSTTELNLTASDGLGSGVASIWYKIDSDNWTLYTGNFTVSTSGAHTIYYNSTDNLRQIEFTKTYDIFVDNLPPDTTLKVGDPKYSSLPTYVNSTTEFSLIASDTGSGVASIWYKIGSGSWMFYSENFRVSTPGADTISYYSKDNLGQSESTKSYEIFVDNTPPTTSISVDEPKYRENDNAFWNVTSATTFILSAIDGGVGLNYTEYRIWYNGTWSERYKYTDGFTLGSENGTRYVIWYSVDCLGNKEMTHNETYFVDNIPPITTYILQFEADNVEARISLIANDVGSGVNFTQYRIGSGSWETYSSTFVIDEPGEHTIYFSSVDKLGNVEQEKNFSVLVEEPDTSIPPSDEEKETNHKPIIALAFAIVLLVLGILISYKFPMEFSDALRTDRLYTFLIGVLPFVVAEVITGLVSLFTGLLSVPPILGIGMIVDLAILIAGLISCAVIFKKGSGAIYTEEQAQTIRSTGFPPPPPPWYLEGELPPPPPPKEIPPPPRGNGEF